MQDGEYREKLLYGQGPGGPDSGRPGEYAGGDPEAPGQPVEIEMACTPGVAPLPGDRSGDGPGDGSGSELGDRPGEGSGNDPGDPPGFLELIYGPLFDPVRTFRRIGAFPPMGKVALVFLTVKLLSVIVFMAGGILSPKWLTGGLPGQDDQALAGMLRAMAPAAAVLGLAYDFVKWFVYSGLLYLLAELFGGRGRASGVLAVTGLASLPGLIFLPVQILALMLDSLSGPLNLLVGIAVMVWGAVLVIVGLRETQGISTGRAVLVAFAPALVLVALVVLLVALIIAMVPMGLLFNQIDDISF